MDTSKDNTLLIYDVEERDVDTPDVKQASGERADRPSAQKPTADVVGTAAVVTAEDEDHTPFHEAIESSMGFDAHSQHLLSKSSAFSVGASGTILQDLCLTWHNINTVVDGASERSGRKKRHMMPKQILHDVSGVAEPGKLLAIMGASGAGKTTLLNILTQRNRKGVVTDGVVKINGHDIGTAIRGISAYVQQEDLFIGTLKVKEHLMFQARLRLGRNKTNEERLERVEEVLTELGLSKCADTLIGIPGRVKGISGGEKKRLAFASELLNNPLLMFCDEPTSGLDAFMAQQVVYVLRRMARRGKTVVCTIHQPSSQVFSYFDNLCLLAEGRVAYLGPAKNAVRFFEQVGHACPPNFNPSDHYIHTLAIVPGRERECKSRVEKFCNAYAAQAMPVPFATPTEKQQVGNDWSSQLEWDEYMAGKSTYKATWLQMFSALMWRGLLATSREPLVVRVRAFQSIIIPLILGLVYFQTEMCCTTVQNVNGVLYLLVGNHIFPYLFDAINVFCEELPVFMREHLSAIYRVDVYYITKTLAELPQYIIFPIIFTSVLYWMAGLRADVTTFFIAVVVTILITNVAVSIGYLVSTMAGDINMALTIAPVFVIPFMLFSGYLLNSSSVPIYFIWLQYLSYFKYAYEALAINEWRGVEHIPECVGQNDTVGCFRSGHDVLNMLSFSEDMLAINIIVLIAMFFAIRLLSFLFLLFHTYRKN